jgi:hypothetical protein
MQQHNLSRTQPRTMSDGNICSNDQKYGGDRGNDGKLIALSGGTPGGTRATHLRAHILCLRPKLPMWQCRARLRARIPPPITLIDELKTSRGKCVADDITLAAARAPAKKVAPSASAPDLAPAPIFSTIPRQRGQ